MTRLTIEPAPRTVRRPARFAARYGPWAVVTGASSGLGEASARILAASGLGVVLVARPSDRLDAIAEALGAEGRKVRVIPADLATPDGVGAALARTADLDVGLLVAAAGFGTSGPFLDADLAVEQQMLDLNCSAVLSLTHGFARRFADRGRGGVVLFGSLVGRQGTPRAAHYGATKAWVQALAEGLHTELSPLGIDVLATTPGPVRSGFADRAAMTMGTAASPEPVALATLHALGHGPTVTPGALSRLLTWSLAPLPRRARVLIMGRVMAGMTGSH